MFTAVLFTIAKIWKQPKCPSVDEWVTKLWFIYTAILHSCKKEGNLTFCDNMDGPGEYHAKWNKPVRERQVPYDLTYMWNLMNKIS